MECWIGAKRVVGVDFFSPSSQQPDDQGLKKEKGVINSRRASGEGGSVLGRSEEEEEEIETQTEVEEVYSNNERL